MVDSQTVGEHHRCLVCGRLYHLQVTYDSQSNIVACAPTDSHVRVLPGLDQLLIVCAQHAGVEVAAALAEHYANADEHDHDHNDGDEIA